MEERKSKKRKSKIPASALSRTSSNCASKYSKRNSEVQENYDHSNVGTSSRRQRLPDRHSDSTSAGLNGNNEEKKASKKRANTPNRYGESDKLANSVFGKSRNDCKKQKGISKQKINETVSICPLEISFSQSTPMRSFKLSFPLKSSETKFSAEAKESLLSRVVNRNFVDKSLLKLPLVSQNFFNFIEAHSGFKKCNKTRKESKVYAPKQKIPLKKSREKPSVSVYEFDAETENNLISSSKAFFSSKICRQTGLEEGCVNPGAFSTGTKTIMKKSMKEKVKPQKKEISFSKNIEVNYVNLQQPTSRGRLSVEKSLLPRPQMSEKICNPSNDVHSELGNSNKKEKIRVQASRAFKNQNQPGNSGENISLCDNKFDGETDGNLVSSSATYIGSRICHPTDVKKGSKTSVTCTGSNNRAEKCANKKSSRRRKKSVLFRGSIESDDPIDCSNLRRSTRTRRAPLRPWCNERARYRTLKNGDIVFVDITDK